MIITSQPVIYLADSVTAGLLIAHFFGRIGCLFYGCCFGKSSGGVCNLTYKHPAHKIIRTGGHSERVVLPVQLMSALYGLAGGLLILMLLQTNTISPGFPASFAAIWYGSWRICEEWLREPSVLWLDFISPAQIPSTMLMLAGLTGLVHLAAVDESVYEPIQISGVIESLHPGLLFFCGLLTALIFSYHYKSVGNWK